MKHAALSLVLQSDTFSRADQLRSFPCYVCERELVGRAGEITEYLIGVEALGRSETFSPNDDTSVRNRAYALSHKLEKFYTEECPSSEIRIEFLKGTYIPRFVVNPPKAEHLEQDAALDHISSSPVPPSPNQAAETGSIAETQVQFPAWRLLVRFRIVSAIVGSLLAGVIIGAFAMR